MEANRLNMLRYYVGSSMIKFDTLNELFNEVTIDADTVVFHIDMAAVLCKCYNEKFADIIDRADDSAVVIDFVVSIMNVLAHYRKFTVFKLHKRSVIFVTYDVELTKYQKSVCPEYREEYMDKYDVDNSIYGRMNKLLHKAYEFIQSIASYFEDIYCMDYDTGVDGLSISAILRNDDRYKNCYHVFFTRNMAATQLVNKNTVVLFNKKDESRLITNKNCLRKGILAGSRESTIKKCGDSISPQMIPYIIMLRGDKRLLPKTKIAPSNKTALKIILSLLDNGQITNGVSIQSFLDELDVYLQSQESSKLKKKKQADVTDIDAVREESDEDEVIPSKLSEEERENLYNRYRVLSIPIVCKSVTKDQVIKIYRRCVNLFNQEYLEKMNEILAQLGTSSQFIEITMLNTNAPDRIEYDGGW